MSLLPKYKSLSRKEQLSVFFALFFPGVFVFIIWVVFGLQEQHNWRLAQYGLAPKTFQGLRGIFFMPFLHSNFNHLFNNSVPLLILGSALFYIYRAVAFKVILIITIICGIGVWLIGEEGSVHIGASGIVYGLAGFLFLSGLLRKQAQLLALSFLVVFLYGSMVWGILPIQRNVSWEGHLWGGIGGFIAALIYRKEGPPRKIYQWEIDEKLEEEFLKQNPEYVEDNLEGSTSSTTNFTIVYHFKENDDDETEDPKG